MHMSSFVRGPCSDIHLDSQGPQHTKKKVERKSVMILVGKKVFYLFWACCRYHQFFKWDVSRNGVYSYIPLLSSSCFGKCCGAPCHFWGSHCYLSASSEMHDASRFFSIGKIFYMWLRGQSFQESNMAMELFPVEDLNHQC